ncbi:MAG: acetate kinase [Parcubacteria group bacterium Licking1014_17]|nr:MAG: acetate kinase [Parcubacteria group bacterium Licking1014_17]
MGKNYLIVNTGSASKKYALYREGELALIAHYETVGKDYILEVKIKENKKSFDVTPEEYKNSAEEVLKLIVRENLLLDVSMITAIGFRVVHGGTNRQPLVIDEKIIKELEALIPMAPLHNAPAIKEIKIFAGLLPNIPQIAVFDTSFHATIPDYARLYAIPQNIPDQHKPQRYGFHGTSYASVLRKVEEMYKKTPEKMVICHLGSGASIAAIKNGKSVDTSMGFTPLEGLVMGTRPGDIDAGLILHLQKELKMSPEKMEEFLNFQCGLRGVSGLTSDVRELIELDKTGDERGVLALGMFAYRVKKYIGAYFAALNGLDALVFTATIGERSSYMRKKICAGLDALGIILDDKKNESKTDGEGEIQKDGAPVKILVIKTDELGQIAREVDLTVEKLSYE